MMIRDAGLESADMGKRFKGGICAYCGEAGETADHVLARGFFPPDMRGGIPQVASCEPCNRAKSEIEHYLLTVLPFGNRHSGASDLLREMVPRRLAKNAKLHRELAEGRVDVKLNEGGTEEQTGAIPFDSPKLFAYFRYVARGLAKARFDSLIPANYSVSAGLVTPEQDNIMRGLFLGQSRAYARGNLGNGLVLYEGQQAVDDPHLTVWRFLLYGGVVFSGDEKTALPISPDLWAVTAKRPMPGLADH